MNFWDRPLTTTESLLVIGAALLLIFLLLRRARRNSQRIAKEFLEQYPNAAVLYLYVADVANNSGTVACQNGIVSKIFDAKDAPGFGVSHGAACYLVPGSVVFDATATWTKDYYLVKRHSRMEAHYSLDAEAGCGYAVIFNPKEQTTQMIKLDKEKGC